jgi:hypothetical protein
LESFYIYEKDLWLIQTVFTASCFIFEDSKDKKLGLCFIENCFEFVFQMVL